MREFCELYKTLIELCNSTLNSAKSDISSIDKYGGTTISDADGFCL